VTAELVDAVDQYVCTVHARMQNNAKSTVRTDTPSLTNAPGNVGAYWSEVVASSSSVGRYSI
jgi:hypothetical protein